MKKILLGCEAIIQGALAAGVDFVSGYAGCPSAEIGDGFASFAKLALSGVEGLKNQNELTL